jgi:pilus assembly protein CpaB
MNRGTRTLIVVAIAIAVATLATMAMYRAVQQIPVREVEQPGIPVVLASRNLPIGTMLTSADLRVANWPARSPVQGGFSSTDQLLNRGLIADMVENEPITSSKLAPTEAGAGLPPIIPPGMRAISMQVNEIIGVAGFVTPGNRVDVVATLNKQDNSMSRVVVTNVKVLAAGTKVDQERVQNGQPIQTTVVTLLVTPEEGEKIALASVEGRLHLTLRNPLDNAPTSTPGVRIATLMGAPEPPPPPQPRVVRTRARAEAPPPPPPPPTPRIYTVEAIRAAKRTEEVVK